ncbi:aldehyde dehydrogenase family protein [Streptomyces albireticuli]|uniref:Betaine-aldehyde dehydrogenase n=1 Tax=Streptomyces albireticuli TaxID=1940 RepID=A0A2A2CXC6_9ACTN|nr:aldehyde dehydrogenase family protein [Streptomyces albireticuli]MCD9144548.1 aldehyde dehydrogenase family protein [Streptomyces albireticuli]MCD9163389.1 aldehyde dehydrogenase family protein [Streptomyces albireticuli]MCD9193226.1 aldehyde dehydrogenase family protein [Streptomyces albireticuli]PAU44848.1 betaine-aldehyde dehydrogenase [Streptomyces albireticuli]
MTNSPEERRMLIGGQWVEAADGATFETVDPATERVLATVPWGRGADVDRAVRAAREAFEPGSPWRKMPPSARGRIIHKIGDLILEHRDELALLESKDNGKPVSFAGFADVPMAADTFHYMSGWATKIEGNTIPMSSASPGRFLSFTQREPLGVVAQIVPWNYPLLMAAWKLAPALAAGCTIVLKPAEQTPLTALRLGELIQEAGVPDGVVNIVTGDGSTGAALVAHPDVDKIAFTGSTEVGKEIIRASADNVKKVTLELGGKSPNVVYADADLEKAIAKSAEAIFFNQGETCFAGSRLYVERSVHDEVVAGLKAAAEQITVGAGTEPATVMGPLVSAEHLDRVMEYVESGVAEGATLCTGGRRVGDKGYFMAPTIFTGTKPHMRIVAEEIFGPVLVVLPFDSLDEIVAIEKDNPYGLAAGVFTRDIDKAFTTASAMRAGTVFVNTWNTVDAALPFGGYKQSGWGRELGHAVLENYLETKSVIAELGR